jgi:hypothetical protein
MNIGMQIIMAVTVLSLLGCASTVLSYVLFPDVRSVSLTFAMWLAFGNAGYALLTFSIYGNNNFEFCQFAAFMDSYLILVCLNIVTVIARSIHRLFNFNQSAWDGPGKKIEITSSHYFFVFVFPIFLSALPFITHSYGLNDGDIFCWILTEDEGKRKNNFGYMWQLVTCYIPFIGCIFYVSYVYFNILSTYSALRVSVLIAIYRVLKFSFTEKTKRRRCGLHNCDD